MGNLNGPLVKKVDVFLNASVPKEADPWESYQQLVLQLLVHWETHLLQV